MPVRDPRALTRDERAALADRCARANMVIYASQDTTADKDLPRLLASQFGLVHLDHNWLADDDGISSVTVAGAGGRGDFIPYTNRPIRWHTDGYYNPPERRIRAMVLHCVSSAASGGENSLFDHEIAYLLLRDTDPEFAAALMQPDAMTIPARTDDAGVVRARRRARCSPWMPTTARCTCATPRARAASSGRTTGPCAPRPRASSACWRARRRTSTALTLKPGMGLLCNNVLHDRSGFVDDPGHPRLIYRARYHDRIRVDR